MKRLKTKRTILFVAIYMCIRSPLIYRPFLFQGSSSIIYQSPATTWWILYRVNRKSDVKSACSHRRIIIYLLASLNGWTYKTRTRHDDGDSIGVGLGVDVDVSQAREY